MSWIPFDGGSTIGIVGSEDGTIVADDEHAAGARITLEANCAHAPFAITCGIYGWFFHTAYASLHTGQELFHSMRHELGIIAALVHEHDRHDLIQVSGKIEAFVERFS